MAYPRRLLGEDEHVVHELHPHWKALVLPALAVPLIVGVASFLWFQMPDGKLQNEARWVVLAVAVVLIVLWGVVPYLRWRTTLYVVTDRRLITRSGILNKQGRDMPLSRVNDASFQHNVIERMLGCGTLVIESAGERGQLTLTDVPRVSDVHQEIYRLVEAEQQRHRGEADTDLDPSA